MSHHYEIGFSELNKEVLLDYFLFHDKEFDPYLSSRVDIDKYVDKIYKNAKIIIARNLENGIIIGLVAFYLNGQSAYLTNINVSKQYQGLGIGNRLMNFLLKNLIKIGCTEISLEVNGNNTNAVRMYLKYGFNYKVDTDGGFKLFSKKIK